MKGATRTETTGMHGCCWRARRPRLAGIKFPGAVMLLACCCCCSRCRWACGGGGGDAGSVRRAQPAQGACRRARACWRDGARLLERRGELHTHGSRQHQEKLDCHHGTAAALQCEWGGAPLVGTAAAPWLLPPLVAVKYRTVPVLVSVNCASVLAPRRAAGVGWRKQMN